MVVLLTSFLIGKDFSPWDSSYLELLPHLLGELVLLRLRAKLLLRLLTLLGEKGYLCFTSFICRTHYANFWGFGTDSKRSIALRRKRPIIPANFRNLRGAYVIFISKKSTRSLIFFFRGHGPLWQKRVAKAIRHLRIWRASENHILSCCEKKRM